MLCLSIKSEGEEYLPYSALSIFPEEKIYMLYTFLCTLDFIAPFFSPIQSPEIRQ